MLSIFFNHTLTDGVGLVDRAFAEIVTIVYFNVSSVILKNYHKAVLGPM